MKSLIRLIRRIFKGKSIQLNEEDPKFIEIKTAWVEEANKMTLKKLPKFIRHLINDYQHDYGTIVHAMTVAAIATCWSINRSPQGGITGYQASFVMWNFIHLWNFPDNKTGLGIVDYDKMLFPQYADNFDKVINPNIWKALQNQTDKYIQEYVNGDIDADPKVFDHWQAISAGKVPFDYRVVED